MPELLIGCGHSRVKKVHLTGRQEWDGLRTLDVNPRCEPEVLHDLNALPYPFDADTFDEIHAYCVLEHCGRQGDWRFFFDQWAEFWRIAKPGGTFHCLVPHHTSPWAWGDPSHTRVIGLECLAFLSQETIWRNRENDTAMSDFGGHYSADWELLTHTRPTPDYFAFILRAVK